MLFKDLKLLYLKKHKLKNFPFKNKAMRRSQTSLRIKTNGIRLRETPSTHGLRL